MGLLWLLLLPCQPHDKKARIRSRVTFWGGKFKAGAVKGSGFRREAKDKRQLVRASLSAFFSPTQTFELLLRRKTDSLHLFLSLGTTVWLALH